MTTFKNNMVGAGAALIALVSLALPVSALAADFSLDGGWDTDYYTDYSSPSYETGGGWDTDYYTDYSTPSYSNTGGWDTDYYTDYAKPISGSGFSMPSFGSANQQYRSSGGYPVFPSYPTYTPPSKANTTVTTNTCVNNSCNYVDNSIVDNSIKISDSYNTVVKESERRNYAHNDCYDYGYNGYADGYGQQGYNYGSYMYQDNCYTYAAPIAYNTTPYISLSQTPYTGLDLGPMGEVLYWTFLVLWCLGAAYLIVVKRVQNKLVSFLGGFLFGGAATKVAHTTHAPAHAHAVASAPLVEEGIDPFIQSQIKRS